MTTTIETPEHLRHYEYDTDPFTARELAAIAEYQNSSDLDDLVGPFRAGAGVLEDCLDHIDFTPLIEDGKVILGTREQVESAFKHLSEWYELLDSLKAGLRREYGSVDGYPVVGPAHSTAAVRYMTGQCNRWYHKLNEVRREACRAAYGTAGPQPEVDSGCLTFFDVPGIELDGTIAAESQ